MNDRLAESESSSGLRGHAVVAGWKLIAAIARGVPKRSIGPITQVIGRLSRLYARRSRSMARRHQSRVRPNRPSEELERDVDDVFARYSQYWIESLRLPHLSASRVDDGIKVDGYEFVQAGLDAGNGVILALPHLGGWEWAGRWLANRSVEVVAVAERLDPPELFEWMSNLRKALGISVIPLDAAAGSAVLSALRRNAVVCLLCDRDIQGGGVEVEFFEEMTTVPAGPAALALRAGAVLLPTAVFHTDRAEGHHGVVLAPVDLNRTGRTLREVIRSASQEVTTALESLIRRAPTQWHLLQPNWESDR